MNVDAPVVCRMLRSKTGYGTMEGGDHPWRFIQSSTANYWCLKTMEPCGPDGEIAHFSVCQMGRECFCEPRSPTP